MPRPSLPATIFCALALCLIGAPSAHAYDPDSRAAPQAVPAAEGAVEGEAASPAASPAAKEAVVDLEPGLKRDALITEYATAGYYELAAAAKALGLTTEGTEEELRARLFAYYGLTAPEPSSATKSRIVTIERAGEASFAKVEEEEGGIVKASGGVILGLVEENGDTHRIRADNIVYNRAKSTLTARGSVYYERVSGDSTEVFRGEAL